MWVSNEGPVMVAPEKIREFRNNIKPFQNLIVFRHQKTGQIVLASGADQLAALGINLPPKKPTAPIVPPQTEVSS